MSDRTIVIAGAGLAGLAAAHELEPGSYRILEAESEPGGLCRSIKTNGFTFDYTGHLLHLKGPMLTRVEKLLDGRLDIIRRKAFIHFRGRLIDYPFQAHLGQLPADARDECLNGFTTVVGHEVDASTFGSWAESTFGAGITKHFMRPYNEKILRTPLEEMSAEAVQYVPRPSIDEVKRGASGEKIDGVGYNAEFRYPCEGGIGALPAALAHGMAVECDAPIEKVVPSAREITVKGASAPYSRLISTIPLPQLVSMLEGSPREVSESGAKLEAVGVLCLNLGVRGRTPDAHWIYFPEPQFPFFRVGFYHRISSSAAPKGLGALYVEISYRKRGDLGGDIVAKAIGALVEAGVIEDPTCVVHCDTLWIDNAYAIHTHARATALVVIKPYLEAHGIIPIGRFGRWAYTSMGEALLEGGATGTRVQGYEGD